MRIVQTFWTAGQDPLKHAFGWLHPEYNLMSWALSCLSLREHYDEVALYTDSEGKRILIDELHLPYTEVNVVFDDFPCLPQHWALSKIKTYSLQTKPFLHVDGDVYVPRPFSEEILQAPLIAQNREIGTRYYREMMDQVLEYKGITYPDYIDDGIRQESVASYNMGVFGGSDIDFIQKYCHEVFQFIENNNINNPKHANSRANCNVLFEQVLLALLTEKEKKNVSCVIDKKIRDNGYTVAEFCDLNRFNFLPYYHILGGHKKSQIVLDMLEKAILRASTEYYLDIIHRFPTRYPRCKKTGKEDFSYLSAERSIALYEDYLTEREKEWRDLPLEEVISLEKRAAESIMFNELEDLASYKFTRNPYFSFFLVPKEWHPWAFEQMKVHLKVDKEYPLTRIAFVPSLTEHGLHDYALSEMGFMLTDIIGNRVMTFKSVFSSVIHKYGIKDKKIQNGIKKHVQIELSILIKNGIVHVKL